MLGPSTALCGRTVRARRLSLASRVVHAARTPQCRQQRRLQRTRRAPARPLRALTHVPVSRACVSNNYVTGSHMTDNNSHLAGSTNHLIGYTSHLSHVLCPNTCTARGHAHTSPMGAPPPNTLWIDDFENCQIGHLRGGNWRSSRRPKES